MFLSVKRAYNTAKRAVLETVVPNGPEFIIGYRDGFPAAGDEPTPDTTHKNGSYRRGFKSGKHDRVQLQQSMSHLFENGVLRDYDEE